MDDYYLLLASYQTELYIWLYMAIHIMMLGNCVCTLAQGAFLLFITTTITQVYIIMQLQLGNKNVAIFRAALMVL